MAEAQCPYCGAKNPIPLATEIRTHCINCNRPIKFTARAGLPPIWDKDDEEQPEERG